MIRRKNSMRQVLLGFLAAMAVAALPVSQAAGQLAVGVPGGVLAVAVPSDTATATFAGKRQLLIDSRAIVGLPLATTPGPQMLVTVSTSGARGELGFIVESKQYPEQHLTIKNQRHVDPNPDDLERIRREAAIMRKVYNTTSPMRTDLQPFVQPLEGPITSLFGFRRVLNGKPRNPHSGLDIAAEAGTAIRSPAPGLVAATGAYFFNGNTVLLDHGGGLITMMCHLTDIKVTEGQTVGRGDVIGTVGSTGRATGPHLHWSVSLQGDRVDPQLAMSAINATEQSPTESTTTVETN